MKRLRIVVLSLCALAVGGLRDQFCTANVNDKGVAPGDPTTELLCKGAGVDPKDVYWRVRAGLSPKQAVEVALQTQFEARLAEFAAKNEKKSDADIRKMAEDAGVDVNGNQSRQQLLIAILQTQDAEGGSTGNAAETAAATPQLNDMTVAELKDHAAANDVDVTGLKKKEDLVAAIQAK